MLICAERWCSWLPCGLWTWYQTWDVWHMSALARVPICSTAHRVNSSNRAKAPSKQPGHPMSREPSLPATLLLRWDATERTQSDLFHLLLCVFLVVLPFFSERHTPFVFSCLHSHSKDILQSPYTCSTCTGFWLTLPFFLFKNPNLTARASSSGGFQWEKIVQATLFWVEWNLWPQIHSLGWFFSVSVGACDAFIAWLRLAVNVSLFHQVCFKLLRLCKVLKSW